MEGLRRKTGRCLIFFLDVLFSLCLLYSCSRALWLFLLHFFLFLFFCGWFPFPILKYVGQSLCDESTYNTDILAK